LKYTGWSIEYTLYEISYEQFFEVYKRSIEFENEQGRQFAYSVFMAASGILSKEGFKSFKDYVLGTELQESESQEIDLEDFGIKTKNDKEEKEIKILKKIELE